MKRTIIAIVSILSTILLCGCGHNVVHVDRGNGMVLRVPAFDGYDLLELKLGSIDSTTMILRGGSTYDSASSSGGSSIGTSGTSGRIFFNSIPQLNEGYLAKVLMDEKIPSEVKKLISEKYLSLAKPDIASPSKSVSVGSAVESGEKSKNLEVKVAGIDNAINKMAETSPEIISKVSNTAKATVEKVTDAVDISPEVVESARTIRNGILILFSSFIAMVVVIMALCLKKR